MPARQWLLLVTGAMALAAAAPALAQSAAPAPQPASPPRWELEMYGGLSLGRLSTGGSLELPGPGAPIPTSSPIYPSWRVPTWFLGDGAAFLNKVAEELGVTARVTPLDAVLNPASVDDAGAAMFGVRVRHPWRGRYSFEAGVDFLSTSVDLSSDLVDAMSATRESFQTTLVQILATGPFTGTTIATTGSEEAGSSREVALTGAIVAEFSPLGGFVPFAVFGGGVIAQVGEPPSVHVEGTYRFLIDGAAPIDETDRLTVEYGQRTVGVGVLGGGLRREFSPRWGLRFDARVLLGPSTTRVAISGRPNVVTATPARFIESFTYPNLQFSNNASTGRESTLSGTLDGFDAFQGGFQTRFRVTAGLVVRF